MEDVFKVMDKDGDGRLSHDDLKSYMNCASFAATDDDIEAMIRLGGGDENDGVSSPSFSKYVLFFILFFSVLVFDLHGDRFCFI